MIQNSVAMDDQLLHEVVRRPAPKHEPGAKPQRKWEGLVTRFTLDDLFDSKRTPQWSAKSKFVLIKGWDHKGKSSHRQASSQKGQRCLSAVTRIMSGKNADSDSPRPRSTTQDLERRLWGGTINASSFSALQKRPSSARRSTRPQSEMTGDTRSLPRSLSHGAISDRLHRSNSPPASSKFGSMDLRAVSSVSRPGRYSSLRFVVPPGRSEDCARRTSLPDGAFAPATSSSITQAARDTRKAYLASMLANESAPGALLPMLEAETRAQKKREKLSSPLKSGAAADSQPVLLNAKGIGSDTPPVMSPMALIAHLRADGDWDVS